MLLPLPSTENVETGGDEENVEEEGFFNKLNRAFTYNTTNQWFETRRPSVIRKRLLKKVHRVHRPERGQKSVGVQTVSRSFSNRVEALEKSKYALDLLRMVDCMMDGVGCVESSLISFHCK